MAQDKSQFPNHLQPPSGTGSFYSDEFVCGITRGACAPAQRDSGRGTREIFEAKKTFEETYPKYPFSELVRLSIGLGKWLGRAARRPHDGTRNHSRHFFGRASSSHR